MRNAVTVAGAELRLFLRDRSNLFFVFVFPLLLVMMIGRAVRRGRPRRPRRGERRRLVAARGQPGPTGSRTTTSWSPTQQWDDALALLARGRLDAAVRVDGAAATAYDVGRPASRLEVVRGSSSRRAGRRAAGPGRRRRGYAPRPQPPSSRSSSTACLPSAARRRSQTAEDEMSPPALKVTVRRQGEPRPSTGSASSTSAHRGSCCSSSSSSCLTGSATLIQARRLGVVARMLAGPVTAGELVAGQVLGAGRSGCSRAATSCSPRACSSAWAGAPCGSRCWCCRALQPGRGRGGHPARHGARERGRRERRWASALGLVLAALGGSMLPLEFFPDGLRVVADVHPARAGPTTPSPRSSAAVPPWSTCSRSSGCSPGWRSCCSASAPGPCAGALPGRCDRPAGRGTRSAGAPTPRPGSGGATDARARTSGR